MTALAERRVRAPVTCHGCGRYLYSPRRRTAGVCALCARARHRWADVAGELDVLLAGGATLETAATRLGMRPDALERALYRHARADLVHRLRRTL